MKIYYNQIFSEMYKMFPHTHTHTKESELLESNKNIPKFAIIIEVNDLNPRGSRRIFERLPRQCIGYADLTFLGVFMRRT